MLDRAKLSQQLTSLADSLFVDHAVENEAVRAAWNRIAHDHTLSNKIRTVQSPWLVPTWQGTIGRTFTVNLPMAYHVLSVDGSQIYPDRHQGPSCYVINIGSIALHYGFPGARVALRTEPFVFAHEDGNQQHMSTDGVNAQRQELELRVGYKLAREVQASIKPDELFALLFDGSLIFWLLEGKQQELRQQYMPLYLASLQQLYQEKILVAGYVSLPKSRELANVMRLVLADFDVTKAENIDAVDHVLDSTIAYYYLKPFERSIVFRNNATVSQEMPEHLRPHFFYLHVGAEIGRVEICGWMAGDDRIVDAIAGIILDQCIKGAGYPVALAEAHEQAVVKGPDRDFFYHLLTKISIEHKKQLAVSVKSMRKRRIGV